MMYVSVCLVKKAISHRSENTYLVSRSNNQPLCSFYVSNTQGCNPYLRHKLNDTNDIALKFAYLRVRAGDMNVSVRSARNLLRELWSYMRVLGQADCFRNHSLFVRRDVIRTICGGNEGDHTDFSNFILSATLRSD